MKDPGLLDQIEQLKDVTGVLAVSRGGWTYSRVFLMDGDLIACNSEEDDPRLEQMLLADGHVKNDALEAVRQSMREGGDLGDHLVRGGHISGDTLSETRYRLFRDTFFWAAAAEAPQMIWDPRSMVFPDNMQFGVDLPSFLQEVGGWLESNRHTLSLLASGDRFVADGRRPQELDDAAWSALRAPHAGKALVEAIGAPSRKEAVESLTSLFAQGLIAIARDAEGRETKAGRPTSPPEERFASAEMAKRIDVALRLTKPDEADQTDQTDEADQTPQTPQTDQTNEADHADQADQADQTDNEDVASADSAQAESEEIDDYERARRGDFIKSYEVLDKVDLSGVDVLGTSDTDSFSDMPAIELGADEEGEDEEDPDLDGMLDALDQNFQALSITSDQIEPLHEVVGPVGMEPQEDDFNVFTDQSDLPEVEPDEDLSEPVVENQQDGQEPSEEPLQSPQTPTGPFTRKELAAYYSKISVFNNIFQIIYSTFADHIGPDNARQRFNALLSSNQRQYPELFQQTMVSDDGTVEPGHIIDNLANCTDRDHGDLLHQGLYELIFSHLYDAKDMLPGDVESAMMERILVHERQLHPG